MTSELVLSLISSARRQEAKQGHFRRHLVERLDELNLVVEIDDADPAARLARFAEEYVEMAPRLLGCIEDAAVRIDRELLFGPFLEAAYAAFARPSPLLARFDGLDALLTKAYLCHRLIEEMYENNRSIRNAKLVDVRTVQANILVHHLIGEPFANELDNITAVVVHQLISSPAYYELDLGQFAEEVRRITGLWLRDHWQNLLTRHHISFRFGG